jgi:hypothetical protein
MTRTSTITCECCDLHVKVPDADGDQQATMCGPCIEHRGANPEMQVRRHMEHSEMLRTHLKAASDWATKAEWERDNAYRRMKQAFSSRNHAVAYLQRINDIHALNLDGSCKCGKRSGCSVASIVSEKWAQQMIARKDKSDEEDDDW